MSAGWRKHPGAWDDFIMRGNWRSLLSTDADRLRTELPSASSSDDVQATVNDVANLLDQVDSWVRAQPKSLRKWLREWWTGEGSSRAWLQLREAEAELATTLPDEIALCRLPEALADARREIGDDDDPAIREATSLYFETYGGGSSIGRPAGVTGADTAGPGTGLGLCSGISGMITECRPKLSDVTRRVACRA